MSSRARWICLWPLPSTSFCITDFRSHNRGFNVRPGVSSKWEWNPKCTYAMPIRAFLLCQASGLLIHYSSSPAASSTLNGQSATCDSRISLTTFWSRKIWFTWCTSSSKLAWPHAHNSFFALQAAAAVILLLLMNNETPTDDQSQWRANSTDAASQLRQQLKERRWW